jgi:hypothetical protein
MRVGPSSTLTTLDAKDITFTTSQNVITGGSNNNMESLRLSINILWHLQPKENLSNG